MEAISKLIEALQQGGWLPAAVAFSALFAIGGFQLYKGNQDDTETAGSVLSMVGLLAMVFFGIGAVVAVFAWLGG